MIHAKRALVFLLLAILLVGCARMKGDTKRGPDIPETTVELQEINLNMLHAMIANLDAEIAAVKQVPATEYPLYNKLRDTDLAGMEARKEMMTILVEHCRFSRDLLIAADEHPEWKQQIFEKWEKHVGEMRVLLNAADKKVNGLERERLRLEFGLVEATLEHKLGGRDGSKAE
jgi:hypothetical protein